METENISVKKIINLIELLDQDLYKDIESVSNLFNSDIVNKLLCINSYYYFYLPKKFQKNEALFLKSINSRNYYNFDKCDCTFRNKFNKKIHQKCCNNSKKIEFPEHIQLNKSLILRYNFDVSRYSYFENKYSIFFNLMLNDKDVLLNYLDRHNRYSCPKSLITWKEADVSFDPITFNVIKNSKKSCDAFIFDKFLKDKDVCKKVITKLDVKYFELFDISLRSELKFVEECLKINYTIFIFCSNEIKDNYDFVNEYIKKGKVIFKYASERLQNDLTLFKKYVYYYKNIEIFPNKFKKDYKLIKEFLTNKINIFEYIDDSLKDKELINLAIKLNCDNINFIPQTKENKLLYREKCLYYLPKQDGIELNPYGYERDYIKEIPKLYEYDIDFFLHLAKYNNYNFNLASRYVQDNLEQYVLDLINMNLTFKVVGNKLKFPKDIIILIETFIPSSEYLRNICNLKNKLLENHLEKMEYENDLYNEFYNTNNNYNDSLDEIFSDY
tara:strand:- start:888 stop:2384 length:1497 start_codon:yes stop_codon:yes gene_type:complete